MRFEIKERSLLLHNKLIPFGDYNAMFFMGIVFVKRLNTKTIKHESIHLKQWFEVMPLVIPLFFINWKWLFLAPAVFYILYLVEWLVKLLVYGKDTYFKISFEKDAYTWQSTPEKRPPYFWLRRIFR